MPSKPQLCLANIPTTMDERQVLDWFNHVNLPPPFKCRVRESSGRNRDANSGIATWNADDDQQAVLNARVHWPNGRYMLIRR